VLELRDVARAALRAGEGRVPWARSEAATQRVAQSLARHNDAARGVSKHGQATTEEDAPMIASPQVKPDMTLLDLVTLVSAHTQSEADLLATVVGMVNGGSVRLCGNFKGARFDLNTFAEA